VKRSKSGLCESDARALANPSFDQCAVLDRGERAAPRGMACPHYPPRSQSRSSLHRKRGEQAAALLPLQGMPRIDRSSQLLQSGEPQSPRRSRPMQLPRVPASRRLATTSTDLLVASSLHCPQPKVAGEATARRRAAAAELSQAPVEDNRCVVGPRVSDRPSQRISITAGARALVLICRSWDGVGRGGGSVMPRPRHTLIAIFASSRKRRVNTDRPLHDSSARGPLDLKTPLARRSRRDAGSSLLQRRER